MEVKNDLFEINTVKLTRSRQNKYVFPKFEEYKENRVIDPKKSQEALEQVLVWLDPLVVRFAWALKRWPKRKDFHESYYRDVYRLRNLHRLQGMEIEDLLQELRCFMLYKIRRYRTRYTTPIVGYASRALFFCSFNLVRKMESDLNCLRKIVG